MENVLITWNPTAVAFIENERHDNTFELAAGLLTHDMKNLTVYWLRISIAREFMGLRSHFWLDGKQRRGCHCSCVGGKCMHTDDKYAFFMFLTSRGFILKTRKKWSLSCCLVVEEFLKTETASGAGGLSNLFAYLYKHQFSSKRKRTRVCRCCMLQSTMKMFITISSLITEQSVISPLLSFPPTSEEINEIYLPRNFIVNLFILYFYLLSFCRFSSCSSTV